MKIGVKTGKTVVTKPQKRVKHVPQRTCVGCRQVLAKRSLVRLVRTENGVVLDPSGKMNGRGAYLHQLRPCWERALKGALAHALKTELSENDHRQLEEIMKNLPDEHGDAA